MNISDILKSIGILKTKEVPIFRASELPLNLLYMNYSMCFDPFRTRSDDCLDYFSTNSWIDRLISSSF